MLTWRFLRGIWFYRDLGIIDTRFFNYFVMAKILDKTGNIVLVKFTLSEFKKLNLSLDNEEWLLSLAKDTEKKWAEFKNSKDMFSYLNK